MEIGVTLKEVPESVDRSKWPVVPSYTEVKLELERGLQLLEKYKKAVSETGVPGFFIRALASYADLINNAQALCKSDAAFKASIPKDHLKALDEGGRFLKKTIEGGKYAKVTSSVLYYTLFAHSHTLLCSSFLSTAKIPKMIVGWTPPQKRAS
jgi:hypothetical protein